MRRSQPMRPRSVLTLALPVLLLASASPSWAAKKKAPEPGAVSQAEFQSWQRTGEVTDIANVLDEALEAKLRYQAQEVRAKSGVDLAVAALPGLPSGKWGKDLETLARRWEVGGRDTGLGNTGVLLVIMKHKDRWVLVWGYPGKGSEAVFAAERGGRPSFVSRSDTQLPARFLTENFRVLAQIYAAYYGFALAPSGSKPEPLTAPAPEPSSAINDEAHLLDAPGRARLEVTLDDVRRNTGAAWMIKTTPGPAQATGWSSVKALDFVGELRLTSRLSAPRSGDLILLIRASDGAGDFATGEGLKAALFAEPSAYDGALPHLDRYSNKEVPHRSLDLSLRDFARRYAAYGGWALSPRWTKDSGLPPLSPDAATPWKPATTRPSAASGQQAPGVTMLSPISTPSAAGPAMLSVYLPLMGLLWFWLTLRALVVDRRKGWVRIIVLCVMGAPCGTGLIAFLSAGFFTAMRDRFGTGLGALVGAMGGAAVGFLLVEGAANPTFKDSQGRYKSYFDVSSPTLDGRWHRPGLMLCRWGLGGVGTGCLALSLILGLLGGTKAGIDSGRYQELIYVTTGIALAVSLIGIAKVAVGEKARVSQDGT